MQNLCGKKFLVVGLGKSGISAARYLAGVGANVTVTDVKTREELGDVLKPISALNIQFKLGANDLSHIENYDTVIASPGVPLDLPQLKDAQKHKIPIIGELELAVTQIDKPIIAVTGTNGKTTTTALIGHLLNLSGQKACVAGNIGICLLDVLDEARQSDFVVLEVSSFQIETTPSLKPYISILLNVTPDHLDRHLSFTAYAECKSNLIHKTPAQGYGIYNVTDEAISAKVLSARCRLIPFDAAGRHLSSKRKKSWGAWFGDGLLNVSLNDVVIKFDLENVTLEGIHNRENMLAALAAALVADADIDALQEALRSFKGLPHRVQLVGEYKGVRFYDDSKGTNVGATIRALEGFAEPVVLIAGGLSKGASFSVMSEQIKKHVKKLVLIGDAAAQMEKEFGGSVDTSLAASMDEAVKIATTTAAPGEVVLLSPACASFDMFKDYADRGDAFQRAVKKVAGKNGR